MSDELAHDLAAFVLARGRASAEARHEAARRILDVLSLAVASGQDRAVRIAHSLAQEREAGSGVTIWGRRGHFDLEGAVLANGVGARYRDMNDAYFNRESLHPSDVIPALCGVAELTGSTTAELLDAVCVAYDVSVDMADVWRTSARGADHVNLIRLATAAAAGRLLGLDESRLVQALAIAATTQIATRQTRCGRLTMWKAYAAADHAVGGLRAARYAAAGVEGPTLAFTGEMGFQAVAVDSSTWVRRWPRRPGDDVAPRILDTHLKVYPLGYLAQAAAEVSIDLHNKLHGDRPVKARVVTYRRAKEIMADPEKWSPDSPETADHSLPYIVSACLLDGRIDVESMGPERWLSADVADLLPSVQVDVDDEMTARYPEEMPVRIEVETADGARLAGEVRWPRGHARRPLSDTELGARSAELLAPVLGDRTDSVVARLLDPDLNEPAAHLWAPLSKGGK